MVMAAMSFHDDGWSPPGRRLWVLVAVLAIIALALAAGLFYHSWTEKSVTVIYMTGTLCTGDSAGGGYTGSEYVGGLLRSAADDPLVGAIVLRVDSPGGTAAAAQEIITDLEYAKQKKPVLVSMGDMATSAAYQVSAHADRIYANPDTYTGSIGVIWIFYDVSDWLEREGMAVDVIKSGGQKDLTSSYRSLTPEERVYVQDLVDDARDYMIEDVMSQRNVSADEIIDARVMRGVEAKEIGLVDELGNLYDTIEGARNYGG